MLTPYDYLFEKIYIVSIPNYLVDEIHGPQGTGKYVTGDKAIDTQIASNLRQVGMTVDKLIEYYNQGIPIYFQHTDDVREIYNATEEHLFNIRERALNSSQSLNRSDIDVNEVMALDDFSSKLAMNYQGEIDVDNSAKARSEVKRGSLQSLLESINNRNPVYETTKVDMSEVIKRGT